MIDWQPIETAPLETIVLINDRYDGVCAARAYSYSGGVGWSPHPCSRESDGLFPTHWAPLPDPPKA